MNTQSIPQHTPKSDLLTGVLTRMAQVLFGFVLIALLLFASAGRLDWGWAWAYLAVYAGAVCFNALVLVPRNLEMIAERGRPKGDTKGWDKGIGLLITATALGSYVVAGLDARWGWTQVATAVQYGALVVVVAGLFLCSWAMASNPFFSTAVRIQSDRGHTVATGGPYRFVRHPGYVGYIASGLAAPLALGSLWALVPAAGLTLVIVLRTALEDKTLQAELAGYTAYAARVRYRLLPGLW